MMSEPELVLDVRAELGEGPVWDAARERLLFVDIMRGHVHEFNPSTGKDRVIEVGQPVGAIAPTVRGDWVIAAKDGFHRLDPKSGKSTLIAKVEADRTDTRMNDGYVDAQGRFWAGTMGLSGVRDRGALYRLDPDGKVHRMLGPVSVSNGIDWSPDNRIMYYVDTRTSRVDMFDFDVSRGAIARRRLYVTIPEEIGYPDGLVVDESGFVWLCLWEGGAVHRLNHDGLVDRIIPMPVTLPTKCAFGGPTLEDLYITTAWIGLDESEKTRQKHAGGLYRIRPGIKGRPPRRFAG